MTPIGGRTKLRVAWGEIPPVPSTLQMPSGRRYLVIGSRGKTLHVIVLGPKDRAVAPVIEWRWAARTRKRGVRVSTFQAGARS